MDTETLKKKLQKQNPLMMSPMAFALAACGGGGSNTSNASNDSPAYGYQITSREMESNNSLSTANYVTNLTFSGQSYSSEDKDYYFVNLPDWRVFDVNFRSDHWGSHDVGILDSKGIGLSMVEVSNQATISADPYHEGGIYIVITSDIYDNEDYTVSVTEGSGNYEREPNDFKDDADVIQASMPIIGQSYSATDDDYFQFQATSSISKLQFSSDHWGTHTVTVLDMAGNIMTIKEISDVGDISTSTFVGDEYLVLVESDIYDDEPYVLSLQGNSSQASESTTNSSIPLANFTEQDTPETPSDYDWAVLDRQEGKFALHIENFEPFEKVFEYVANGGHSLKYTIAYGDINSEDPGYVTKNYSDYSWINADDMEVSGSGYLKQVIVKDDLLKNTIIDSGFDYISFGITSSEGFGLFTNTAWAVDDFAVSEVVIG